MDTARYGVALVLVCVLPPLLLFWPLVHGFVGLWRRAGPVASYGILLTATVAGVLGLYRIRSTLLALDFGTSRLLAVAAAVCLGIAIWLRVRIQREMPAATLVGLPELRSDGRPEGLVTSGIYARMRHPRYVQFSIAMLACALFANHLASYAALGLWLAAVAAIVPLEERELRARFGRAYQEYSRRVPRYPRSLSSAGSLLVFLALATCAAAMGALFQPGAWYAGLRKPPLTPPDWLFGPVWSALYLAMAVAAWLVWRARGRVGLALWLWGGQLAANAAWSALFFGLQRPGLGLLDIVLLWLLVLATTVAFFRARPLAGALLVPYLAWVGFAAYLNAALWHLNRQGGP